jgi:RNA polymerase sigma-54 factor
MAQGMHLSQRMALSQVLAPQLQQSLALLQAPTLELRNLVEQELAQNPLLEEVAVTEGDEMEGKVSEESQSAAEAADPTEPPADTQFDPATEKETNEPVDDFQAEFEKLVQIDQEWRDVSSASNAPLRQSDDAEEKRQFMFDSLTTSESLQESLLEQVRQSDLTQDDYSVAELLIGNIDERGYLKSGPGELSAMTGLPAAKLEEVLRVVQTFHPAGVGARDLQECLLIQLDALGKKNTLEYQIVQDHMDALTRRRLPEIARGCGVEIDEVQDAMEEIAKLDPRPGRQFLQEDIRYVVPEVFVTKLNGEWNVSTNDDHVPHLRISNTYKDLMANSGSNAEVRDYIRDKIRAGKFLIKSLHQRQQTILNIAREILKRQRDYFEKGVSHLKPLTMVQVAEVVGVHETTVSRAVSGKFMQTPTGIIEMKYFFTSGLQTSDGEGVSNTSVKDMISALFKNENSNKPLSDQEVVKMVRAKGIVLARRTVAKYRAELNILPSNLRKQY